MLLGGLDLVWNKYYADMTVKLKKYKLGELIELVTETNSNNTFGVDFVRGVSNTKEIQATKANMTGRNLSKFLVVRKGGFVFNRRTTRNGERLGLGYNDTEDIYIFTEDYVSFKVKCMELLDPTFLYIFFKRNEFDRYVRYNSWGSATEFFNWDDMCETPITLPDIFIQRKYVAIYKGLQDNLAAYQSNLDDLKLTCDAYIDRLRHTIEPVRIGDYIEVVDKKNKEGRDLQMLGMNKEKVFMPTVATTTNLNKAKYKVLRKGRFCFSGMQTGRDKCIRIALYNEDVDALISPAYTMFELNSKAILPEYFMMLFQRSEMDRLGAFLSDGSVRANLDWDVFCDIKLPFPNLEIQESIVKIFKVYNERKKIAEKLKQQLSDICPILIKGALEEGGAYGKEE